jgi:hypothetical protein
LTTCQAAFGSGDGAKELDRARGTCAGAVQKHPLVAARDAQVLGHALGAPAVDLAQR